MGLGDLPGGTFQSSAGAISGDGSTVVGYSRSGSGQEAFRWRLQTGMVGLGDLGGASTFNSDARGASADGSVVVGLGFGANGTEAFRWTAGNGMVGLGDLPGGLFGSIGQGVSSNGSVVVGGSYSASSGTFTEAFRWTEADGMVGLGDLPGGVSFRSSARAVSADGSIVVGFGTSPDGFEAFRWTGAEGMVGLGELPGGSFFSSGRAISADGSTVVGDSRSGSGQEAFRWTLQTGMVGLGDLPGGNFESQASGVSADGSIVVGVSHADLFEPPSYGYRAFIWDSEAGIRSFQDVLVSEFGLDLTGWVLQGASAISADGLTIAGGGINPDGYGEAWIAHLPEPGTLVLLLAGGFLALHGRKGRW